MGKHKNKAYNLRLKEELMDKVREIAKKEYRPLSHQLEMIIKEYIEKYEKENGEIKVEDNNI